MIGPPSWVEPPHGEPGDYLLLGATTLEGFGLVFDPFRRKLRAMQLPLPIQIIRNVTHARDEATELLIRQGTRRCETLATYIALDFPFRRWYGPRRGQAFGTDSPGDSRSRPPGPRPRPFSSPDRPPARFQVQFAPHRAVHIAP